MRSLLVFTLLSICVVQMLGKFEHKCLHDHIEHKFEHHDVIPHEEYAKRNLADDNWAPIRIVANYDQLTGLTSAQSNFVRTQLIPAAIAFFQSTISVVRLTSRLTLPNSSCQGFRVPSTLVSPGVSADLVLIVAAGLSSGSALAVGGACFLGNDKRPIAGIVNFSPSTIDPNQDVFADQLAVIQHEITHVLGFSSSMMPYWKTSQTVTRTVNWRGSTRTIVATSRVAEVARRYFGCSNITGVELENEGSTGSSGSAGSHWERRTLGNEAMTSSASKDARYSSFTLALLEDSGWYQADYSQAAALTYGQGDGCAFVFQTCINTATKQARFPEFCATSNQLGCTQSGTAKAVCAMGTSANPVNNYFGNNRVGLDTFSDECPIFLAYSNGDCRDTSQSSSYYLPEVFGSNSRCLSGTLLDKRYSSDGTVRVGCYPITCKMVNNVPRVYLTLGSYTYLCPVGGGPVSGIIGYTGTINCPVESIYCSEFNSVIDPNLNAIEKEKVIIPDDNNNSTNPKKIE